MSARVEPSINKNEFDKFLLTINEKLNNINHIIQENKSKPFTILFCGAFSTGKTSLINALLGKQCELPTSILPTTKVVTHIKYGSALRISVTGKARKYTSFAEVAPIIKGEGDEDGKVMEVQIEFPSVLLKNNVEFVDTPGINDDSKGMLDDITRREINNADLCIAVFNPTKFVDVTERKFLNNVNALVGGNCVSIINCINYINTQKDYEDLEARAKSVLRIYGNDIVGKGKYFFVCSDKRYLDFGDFDTWLKKIIDYKADKIKRVTRSSVLSENMNKISLAWYNKYCEVSNVFQQVNNINEKNKLVKKEKLLYSVNSLWSQILQENKSMMTDLNGAFIDRIYKEIDAKKDNIYQYTEKLNEAIKKATVNFFESQINKLKNNHLELLGDIKNYDLNYWISKTIMDYSVPKPISQQHEKGILKRAFDVLDDAVDGIFMLGISGGKYYYTYNDYTEASKKSFREEALPKLKRDFEAFFEYIISSICCKADIVIGGLESEIVNVNNNLESLITLYQGIKNASKNLSHICDNVNILKQDTWICIPEYLKKITVFEEVQVSVINSTESYSLVYLIEEGSDIVDVKWG